MSSESVRTPAPELYVREEGTASAPAVIFCNSLGTGISVWSPQAEALEGRFKTLRYDQRGHGRSPTLTGPDSIDQLGLDALGVLDRAGVERASFVGISLGGAVGMWLASEAPDRIDRLVLCCTSTTFGPWEPWLERAERVRADGVGPIVDEVMGRWFTSHFRRTEPGTVDRFATGLEATDPGTYAACCELIGALDLRERLASIRAPTAIVAAEDDPATPPDEVRKIADGIPGADFSVLSNAAHLASIERPRELTEILLEHLTEG